ncbi:MAG: hypothetical protein D6756_00375, partial [Cyanobacteria bacterium J083]
LIVSDLSPKVEDSPVLKKWQQQIPNILQEIRQEPSFTTRWRLGYSFFPSNNQTVGINLGVEDIFLGDQGLTISADYYTAEEREALGTDLRYYLLALGNYLNIAPSIGYRYIATEDYETDGIKLGVKLMLVVSRTGAGDISLTQSFIAPGTEDEVSITTLSVGYAIARQIRLGTDIEQQNSKANKDSRISLVLEWIQ